MEGRAHLDALARDNAAIHSRYRSKSPIHYERPAFDGVDERVRQHQYYSRFGAELGVPVPGPRYHRTSASNVAHLSPEQLPVITQGGRHEVGPPVVVRERVVGHSS